MMALSIILKSDDKKRINIKATAIIGKTLFTKLYGGRGERKSGSRFQRTNC